MGQVSLQDFVERGVFGPIVKGSPQAEVEQAFGKAEKRKGRNAWVYGFVEIRFGPSDRLVEGVHVGCWPNPKGWGGLNLDPWIIRDELSLAEFLGELDKVGLSYSTVRAPQSRLTVVVLSSGLYVGFIQLSSEGPPTVLWLSSWVFPVLRQHLKRGTHDG